MSITGLGSDETYAGRPVAGALAAALTALRDAAVEQVWRLTDDELAACVDLGQQVCAAAQALTLAAVVDADTRGLRTDTSQTRTDWILSAAPGIDPRDATRYARLASACHHPALARLSQAATTGSLDVAKADHIATFALHAAPLTGWDQLTPTLDVLTDQAPAMTRTDVRAAIRYAMAHLTPAPDLDRADHARRAARAFHHTGTTGTGMTEYRLLLDPEGAALIDTAIDTHSAPHPDPDTGHRDPRPAATRRADALLDLITRAMSDPPTQPGAPRTQLVVTINYHALRDALTTDPHAARGAGTTPGGHILSPATVRRLACDADLIPAVLGTRHEILDHGRRRRLVTPSQRLHLWLRDQHCTYPGCTIPAPWCDAHHLIHWADGGPTNTDNLALLCRRHHTTVHTRTLTATTTRHAPPGTAVTWHTTPTQTASTPTNQTGTDPPPPP